MYEAGTAQSAPVSKSELVFVCLLLLLSNDGVLIRHYPHHSRLNRNFFRNWTIFWSPTLNWCVRMNRPIFGWHRLISSQFAHAKHDRRHHFDDPSCQIKRVPIWFWRCDGFCFRTFFLLYVHQWDILVNWRNTTVGAIYSLIYMNREIELNSSSNVDETTRENVGANERCPADVSSTPTPISIHINGTHIFCSR